MRAPRTPVGVRPTEPAAAVNVAPSPVAAAGPTTPQRRHRPLLRLLASIAAVLCALALPFAPVQDESTTVRWSATQGTTSALFVPYRAESFRADVPCAETRRAAASPAPVVLLATAPPANPRHGLVISAQGGKLDIGLDARVARAEVPLTGPCAVVVNSSVTGTTVVVGGREVLRVEGDAVPEVFAFRSDLSSTGVTVEATTRNWFESSPSPLKKLLIAAFVVLLIVGLATVLPARRRATGTRPRTAWRLAPIDAAVAMIISWWVLVGPITDDDGFSAVAVRNGMISGDIGNYYRWFNASEAPFTLLHHLVQPLTALSMSPVLLRLPSAAAGLATWFLLSRGVLGQVLGPVTLPARLLTALIFLIWWLPYDLGLRPEPFIALGTAAVLALLLRARRQVQQSQDAVGLLAAAALVAGLSLATTPTGLLAVALFFVFAPTVLAVLQRKSREGGRLLGPTAALALMAASGAVFLVVAFADQTLTGVRRATELHRSFGPNFGWYQEDGRYSALLTTVHPWGTATKRLPVFLTLIMLVLIAILITRRFHHRLSMPDLPVLAAAAATGFIVLVLNPSKWTHHFGALVGVGVPLVVAALVLVWRAASTHPAVDAVDRRLITTAALGAAALATAAALTFVGRNTWWMHSDAQIPWNAEPIAPLGLPLPSPLLWLAVAAVPSVFAFARAHRARADRSVRLARAATVAPVAVAVTAATTSLLVLLGSFTFAAVGREDVHTPGRANLLAVKAAFGNGTSSACGLQDQLEVLPLARNGVLQPVFGTTRTDRFLRGRGFNLPPPLPPASAREGAPAVQDVWGSLDGGVGATGELQTAWYDLPKLGSRQQLALWVAGRIGDGNAVTLQFGRRVGQGVQALGEHVVPPVVSPEPLPYNDPVNGRPQRFRDLDRWRSTGISAEQVPTSSEVVRVRALDGSTDRQGWVAVTSPAVRDVMRLDRFLDDRGPVLVDWPIAFAFPCRIDAPAVRGGLAQTPRVIIRTPRRYGEGVDMTYIPELGGTFYGLKSGAAWIEVPSRVVGDPDIEWGQVMVPLTPRPNDNYTASTTTSRAPGHQPTSPYPFPPP